MKFSYHIAIKTQVQNKYFGMKLASYFSFTRRLRADEMREIYAPWDPLSSRTLPKQKLKFT
jgi:hypothetical protein